MIPKNHLTSTRKKYPLFILQVEPFLASKKFLLEEDIEWIGKGIGEGVVEGIAKMRGWMGNVTEFLSFMKPVGEKHMC
jgi:hypothetical protein